MLPIPSITVAMNWHVRWRMEQTWLLMNGMKKMNMQKNNEANSNLLCSWSGGKDSCFALMQAVQNGYRPAVLLNVLNETGKISRSHGIPADILQLQAKAADLPLQ